MTINGTVKQYDVLKGYGFIIGEDQRQYFFHYSQLVMEGRKSITAGQSVVFEPVESKLGLQAHDIQRF